MPLTTQGRAAALAALADRRAKYRGLKLPRNESLPAGSPMYYRCIGCGAPIVMHETWITKPDCCDECAAMARLGWLE